MNYLFQGSPLFPKRKKSGHPEALDLEALTDELDDYSGDEDGVVGLFGFIRSSFHDD